MKIEKQTAIKYMQLAIDEMMLSVAERRKDNKAVPKVGAVLVLSRGEKEIVTRAHRGELRNGDHAEYTLLDRKLRDKDLTGGILFATLEPCAPGSRKPPKSSCAERIVNARISKVYVGLQDPDPTVAGKGIRHLIDNGIEVELFPQDLQDIIKEENSDFLRQATERAQEESTGTESKINTRASLSDLSDDALNLYGTNIGLSRQHVITHLERIGLLKTNSDNLLSPTKECLVLFGQNPSELIQGAYISIKRKGKTSAGDIIKYIYSPMVLAVKELETWYRESFQDQLYDNTMQRNTSQDPRFHVFREAVVNAIVHRDYLIGNASITITASDEMIEVKSPGAPPTPITVDMLNTFRVPVFARNPEIAFVFREMRYSESVGHGLDLMRELHSIGLPYPNYSYDGINLVLSIPFTKNSLISIFPGLSGLSSQELEIIELIRDKTEITKSQVAATLNISEKTAQRRLSSLMSKGIISGNGEEKTSKNYGYILSDIIQS